MKKFSTHIRLLIVVLLGIALLIGCAKRQGSSVNEILGGAGDIRLMNCPEHLLPVIAANDAKATCFAFYPSRTSSTALTADLTPSTDSTSSSDSTNSANPTLATSPAEKSFSANPTLGLLGLIVEPTASASKKPKRSQNSESTPIPSTEASTTAEALPSFGSASLPLVVIPDGADGQHNFWDPQHGAELLETFIGTLNWEGSLISFSPQSPFHQAPGRGEDQKKKFCGNFIKTYLDARPEERGTAYQDLFRSCFTTLHRVLTQSPSAKATQEDSAPLARYSSYAFARSIAHLLARMPEEHFQLVAFGAGSRTALFMADAWPTKIDRVLVESISPPGFHSLDHLSQTLASLFRRLEQACKKETTSCARKFSSRLMPTLTRSLDTLIKTPRYSESLVAASPSREDIEALLTSPPSYYIDAHAYLNYLLTFFGENETLIHLPAVIAKGVSGKTLIPAPLPKSSTPPAPPQKTTSVNDPIFTALFQSLWQCNDRSSLLGRHRPFDPLSSESTKSINESRLPNAIKTIIREEWTATPCAVVPITISETGTSATRTTTAPAGQSNTNIKNSARQSSSSVGREAPKIISTQRPVWIFTAELHPVYAPELSDHPSLKLAKKRVFPFSGETQNLIRQNVCAQTITKYFLQQQESALELNAAATNLHKVLPCSKDISKKLFSFTSG